MNPHSPFGKTDFLYHYGFRHQRAVCGLDYAFIRSGWLPSSLYTFLKIQASLGIATLEGLPNLTTFSQRIPSLLLKLIKSVASANFATPPR